MHDLLKETDIQLQRVASLNKSRNDIEPLFMEH